MAVISAPRVSVTWMSSKKAVIVVPKADTEEDAVFMTAVDAGADEVPGDERTGRSRRSREPGRGRPSGRWRAAGMTPARAEIECCLPHDAGLRLRRPKLLSC